MTGYIIWHTASHAKRMHFVSCRGRGRERDRLQDAVSPAPLPGHTGTWYKSCLRLGQPIWPALAEHMQREVRVFHQSFCQPLGGTSLWESLRIGTKPIVARVMLRSICSQRSELGAGNVIFTNLLHSSCQIERFSDSDTNTNDLGWKSHSVILPTSTVWSYL